MSHWDFGRPPGGRHDAPGPGGQGDAAYPDTVRSQGGPRLARDDRTSDDPWSAGYAWPPDDSGAAGDGGWPADDSGAAGDGGWPADDSGGAGGGGWPAGDPWPADNGWTRDDPRQPGGWPRDGDGLAGLGLVAEDEGEGTGPYPITYERDTFIAADAGPDGQATDEDYQPWPPAPHPGPPGNRLGTALLADHAADEYAKRADSSAGGRRDRAPWRPAARPGRPEPAAAGPAWPGQVPGEPGENWAYEGRGGRRGGARRWLIPAVIVVAGVTAGVSAVLLTSGRPAGQAGQGAGRPSATQAATPRSMAHATTSTAATPAGAPITVAAAQQVLAGYTTANNAANAQRSDALLATVEAGSSYAIDAGLYQTQRAAGSAPFPPFSPVQATYYIPRGEPAAGPRWFVVQVGNAFTSNLAKVTSAEYLLFTQPAPGGPWQDVIEPYLLPGASAPRVAVGADGLATAVTPDAATVLVAPGQLPAVTAASLDGAGNEQTAVVPPANLADRADLRTWQAKVQGGQVSDAHSAASGADGQEFALQTADGGALVFYTDAAEVTITPPAGTQLQLTIPGFYSPGQALAQARVSYLEQFAAYDPPAASGSAPSVVADYSAITGAG